MICGVSRYLNFNLCSCRLLLHAALHCWTVPLHWQQMLGWWWPCKTSCQGIQSRCSRGSRSTLAPGEARQQGTSIYEEGCGAVPASSPAQAYQKCKSLTVLGCEVTSLSCAEAQLSANHVHRLRGSIEALQLYAAQLTPASELSCSTEYLSIKRVARSSAQ